MGCVKVIISFLVIAFMELVMDGKWSNDMSEYVFEISMSILMAGWIANNKW